MTEPAVYTPIEEALAELKRRQSDDGLAAYVERTLPQGLPPSFASDGKNLVLFRHVATPNHETFRFISAADALPELTPQILEYHEDQFNDRNQYKHLLGKLRFDKGLSRHGEPLFEKTSLINFNTSNTKPFAHIATHWEQPFVHFHHELFGRRFPQFVGCSHDISAWLHASGPKASDYYQPFFTLFVRDGILLENFRLDEAEAAFTRSIMLPAFERIEAACGVKPLIVRLLPAEVETDDFWYSYPYTMKAWVDEKMVVLERLLS